MIDSSELVDSAINDTVFVHLLGGLDNSEIIFWKTVSALKGTKSTSCGHCTSCGFGRLLGQGSQATKAFGLHACYLHLSGLH